MTDQRYHLAGVMGWPVMHSRSPLMHNHWFAETGLAGRYVFLPLPPERLEAALRALPALNFVGCNLTIPHKSQALRVVDEIDDGGGAHRCDQLRGGAAGRIAVRHQQRLAGVSGQPAAGGAGLDRGRPGRPRCLGAGGGARAVCHALLAAGVPEIRLVNRTLERARRIAEEFGGPIEPLPWDQRHAALDGAATVVNATSLGMVGQPPLEIRLDRLAADGRGGGHRLFAFADRVPDRGRRARQPHRGRSGDAAAPGPAGLEAVVRHRAGGQPRAPQRDGGKPAGGRVPGVTAGEAGRMVAIAGTPRHPRRCCGSLAAGMVRPTDPQ